MMYRQNNGIIRGFAILAMLLGMILYHSALSELLVDIISELINKILAFIGRVIGILLFPIKWLFGRIKRIFVWIFSKIKKFTYFLIKILKNIRKSSKMTVSENEENN